MYTFFVGCDVSKATLDVAYIVEGKSVYFGQFANDHAGFIHMIDELSLVTTEPTDSWFILFENTGLYSKALLEWLISYEIPCREEGPILIAKSARMKRGKSDRLDSEVICKYLYQFRDVILPSRLPNPLIVKLKHLLSRRDFLTRQIRSVRASTNKKSMVLEPVIFEFMHDQDAQVISILKKQISDTDALIAETIKQNPQMDKNNQLIQTVIGIGPVIAAYMIAFTDNFSSFSRARKFASYCGTAPILHYQSGTNKGRYKVSKKANKKIKSLLTMGARSARVHDPEIRLYFDRKIDQGKKSSVVINNVKNKLIQRAFATVRRQSPYVKMMNYA